MRVALAQLDATVGDVRGNMARVRAAAKKASAQGADLTVFPEQMLGGYPALDLLEDPGFVRANREALKALAREAGEMGLLVGFVDENPRAAGKPVANAAALLHRGKVAAVRWKTLLPTYDVFDEARHFEPAAGNEPVRFLGRRLGVTICEDAWSRRGPRRLYAKDPVASLAAAGCDFLVNLSASPFERGKTALRRGLFAAQARRARKPFLYCNLVGGDDELIFDGGSLVFDARGRLAARGKAFAEDLVVVDLGALAPLPPEPETPDIQEVSAALELGLRDYARKCGFAKVLVGLSGGIDSAVVCALAVRALGAASVTGVSMPSMHSSEGSVVDAEALARNLGIRLLSLPITDIYRSFMKTLSGPFSGTREGAAEQNLQARIRGTLLMALANKEDGLLLSTGNKSELSVGYCTLYGDMSGGLSVLADVPKVAVYELARWINRGGEVIPRSSIEKAPSAELKPGQKDQDDLPPYETLDAILTAYIEGRKEAEEIAALGYPPALVGDILGRIDRAEYKRRQAAPSLKISPKAFGAGRRMPIARGSYR